MNNKELAVKDIEAARPVTPEALLHRAQTRALLHLAERVEELIAIVSFAAGVKTAQHLAEAKPPVE